MQKLEAIVVGRARTVLEGDAGDAHGVAFVDAAQVPKGLKVIKIDGKLPGDKEYRLR